jgi:hypothetical protein
MAFLSRNVEHFPTLKLHQVLAREEGDLKTKVGEEHKEIE